MAHRRRRSRKRIVARKPVFQSQKYNLQSLREDREYGLYWYAWLWKIFRPILIFFCSVLIVIGMVTMGYNMLYDTFLAPMDKTSAEIVEFKIESGSSVSAIGNKLEEAKLLRNSSIFKYLVQFEGLTNQMSYGTFKLSPGMTVNQIIDELTSGSQTNERVITIVPGWTCEDIADYLVSIGALKEPAEFLQLCNDVDRFAGHSYALRGAQEIGALNGRKYAIEGYLAPDTYRVFLSANAESIIKTLLNQHNKVVDDVFYADNTQYYTDEEGNYHEVETYDSKLTMDQSIVLASMIEKEAGNKADYAKVSAVFHNRMNKGWKLESDPTATYLSGESKLALSTEEISQANNYNTYVVPSLPVGPICNPSAAALKAALEPDLTYINEGYMYFCATEPTSGTLAFAKTKEEHEANVARYRPLWEEYDRQQAAAQNAG